MTRIHQIRLQRTGQKFCTICLFQLFLAITKARLGSRQARLRRRVVDLQRRGNCKLKVVNVTFHSAPGRRRCRRSASDQVQLYVRQRYYFGEGRGLGLQMLNFVNYVFIDGGRSRGRTRVPRGCITRRRRVTFLYLVSLRLVHICFVLNTVVGTFGMRNYQCECGRMLERCENFLGVHFAKRSRCICSTFLSHSFQYQNERERLIELNISTLFC